MTAPLCAEMLGLARAPPIPTYGSGMQDARHLCRYPCLQGGRGNSAWLREKPAALRKIYRPIGR
jgi:hypothetical protein